MGLKYTNTLREKIQQAIKTMPRQVASAVYLEANVEMTESKKRCPVDIRPNAPHPGQLRASGYVELPVVTGDNVSIELGYTASYAIYVHENLEAHHPVGEAKFLESVLQESAPFMLERIARRLDLT